MTAVGGLEDANNWSRFDRSFTLAAPFLVAHNGCNLPALEQL